MKKLLTTLVTFAALTFGSLAFTPTLAANAAEGCSPDNPGSIDFPCEPAPCTPDNPPTPDDPCTPVPDNPVIDPCPPADTTAARTEVATVPLAQFQATAERADRLQVVADRRAETIKRLRAKIRALR